MDGLKRPYISYNHGQNVLYPDQAAEDYREPGQVERFDHVSANGRTLSYEVGPRDFIECVIPWQSDALVGAKRAPAANTWWHWWESVRNGATFYYSTIDTIAICGDGTICNDGTLCGQGDTAASEDILVKADMVEFVPEWEEVHGYWRVGLRMREVV